MFKKVALIVLLFTGLFAREYNFYEAIDDAKRNGKPVYLLVVSSKCIHCKHHIDNTIIPNFKEINRNFNFAIIDIEVDKLPPNLPFNGTTPTTYLFSAKGDLLVSPIEGDFDSNSLHQILNELYKAYTSNYKGN